MTVIPQHCACGHLWQVHDIGDRRGARVRTKCLVGTGPRGLVCPCKMYDPAQVEEATA